LSQGAQGFLIDARVNFSRIDVLVSEDVADLGERGPTA
jgi:hypothetical protein